MEEIPAEQENLYTLLARTAIYMKSMMKSWAELFPLRITEEEPCSPLGERPEPDVWKPLSLPEHQCWPEVRNQLVKWASVRAEGSGDEGHS